MQSHWSHLRSQPAKVEEPAPVEISELASEEAHSVGKGEPASLLAAGLKIGPPPPYKTPLSAEQLMLLEEIDKVGHEMNLAMKRFVKRRGVFREVLLMGAYAQAERRPILGHDQIDTGGGKGQQSSSPENGVRRFRGG